jgi:prolyl-tRNA synthetase
MNHIKTPMTADDFATCLDELNLCLIKWCGSDACEKHIKEQYHAKSLCIPLDLPATIVVGDTHCCTICNDRADMNVLFGRSY